MNHHYYLTDEELLNMSTESDTWLILLGHLASCSWARDFCLIFLLFFSISSVRKCGWRHRFGVFEILWMPWFSALSDIRLYFLIFSYTSGYSNELLLFGVEFYHSSYTFYFFSSLLAWTYDIEGIHIFLCVHMTSQCTPMLWHANHSLI